MAQNSLDLKQCWQRFVMPYGVSGPQWVKGQEHFYCRSLILYVLNWLEKTSGPRFNIKMTSFQYRSLILYVLNWLEKTSGPRFNIKMTSFQYRKSHCGDKMILRPSYLHNGITCTGKTTSLYWIGAQNIFKSSIISQHWYCVGSWNYSLYKTRGSHLSNTDNTTVADDLIAQRVRHQQTWYWPNSPIIFLRKKCSKIWIEMIKFSVKYITCKMAVILFRSKCVKWQGLM